MTDIKAISTNRAAPAGGHYSQGIARDDLLFISGQLPVLCDGSHTAASSDFETQCRQALANLFAVIAAAGSTREHVLKVTAYIVGAVHWGSFNRVYAELFGEMRPARSVVPVPELHHGYLVEIDAIAALPLVQRSSSPSS